MLSLGFRFAGLGDDARQEGDGSTRVLPDSWNAQGPHVYSLRYSHPQSSLTFVIKAIKLGDRYVLHGLAIGDDKTATLDIPVQDYTSPSFYPYDPQNATEPLIHGFISSSRLNDFIILFKTSIIQRLMPGLNKPGYEEESSGTQTSRTANPSTAGQPQQPPPPGSRSPPRVRPPIFDDPLAADEPWAGENPYSVGRADLEPLGGAGGLRMPGSGGGMYVGPEHPMFGGHHPSSGGDSDIFGGPQGLPRGAVPPGARFDPIGPFGNMPSRGGRGGRGGGGRGRGSRGGGGAGSFFSGEPDNDELPPPGSHDMFL
ncbi:PI31 proteasome regulator N-terminal-domain-containing protein [Syncephalastrum racemosum]|uniref:PI31 proteasome regulator N-terminal-domain-containing protein n=1 Tax=Syncephalastrum racemosum TaxID=13706 RepID=A0A1X2HV26_SYNRA|nr:PI31 proteasome regulator N-terminal-domain-containing protein [Syncephalastrum racemosum]